MNKLNILVLFGGCSSEYAISLESAYSVLENLDKEKYNVIAVGITRKGKWYRYKGDFDKVPADKWQEDESLLTPCIMSADRTEHALYEFDEGSYTKTPVDLAFPVLHGKNGEDGTVQGIFEMAGIPIIGCGVLASALCMDKDRAHKVCKEFGVDAPASMSFTAYDMEEALKRMGKDFKYPVFVKPVRAGSSYGISKVHKEEDLRSAIELAFEYDTEVTVEESIDGFEVGCAVLGRDELIIGRVDEIEIFSDFFDFDEKYHRNKAKIYNPARIDQETEERIKEVAARAYKALGCTGFARVDLFYTPDGKILLNEINTIPGFTVHSRYPSMIKGIGLSFKEMLDKLVSLYTE